jgi:hypothetical protein
MDARAGTKSSMPKMDSFAVFAFLACILGQFKGDCATVTRPGRQVSLVGTHAEPGVAVVYDWMNNRSRAWIYDKY